jgi:hypothetical protein
LNKANNTAKPTTRQSNSQQRNKTRTQKMIGSTLKYFALGSLFASGVVPMAVTLNETMNVVEVPLSLQSF